MTFFADAVIAPLLRDAQIYFLIFGVVMVLGGVIGYVKARSVPSLVAGGISGLILIVSALCIPRGWYTWMIVDFVVSLLLAGRFAPSLLRRKYNPAAYVVPLAVVGAILAAYVLAVVLQP